MASLGSTEPYVPTEEDVIPEPLVAKYALGQIIFYMKDNKVHAAEVVSRKVVENLHDDWASNDEQKMVWQHFGVSCIVYKTVHGKYYEDEVFASREDLLEAL